MTRHRKYRSQRRTPRVPKGTYRGQVAPGDDLGQAADVIAQEARRIARGNGMPETAASIGVQVDGHRAIVYSDSPAAYPNEIPGVRHPVFGPTLKNPRPAWVANEYRPFLGPAADAKASAAMDRYAKKLDRMLKKAGFGA